MFSLFHTSRIPPRAESTATRQQLYSGSFHEDALGLYAPV